MTTPNTNEKAAALAEASAKHTPGPWRLAEEYRGARCIYGRSVDPFTDQPLKHDTFLCAVQEGTFIYEREANARLIAAAPETARKLSEAQAALARVTAQRDALFSQMCEIISASPQKAYAIAQAAIAAIVETSQQ